MTCSGTEEVTLRDTKEMRHAGARRKARVDRTGIPTQGVCFKQKAEMVKWCEGLEVPRMENSWLQDKNSSHAYVLLCFIS